MRGFFIVEISTKPQHLQRLQLISEQEKDRREAVNIMLVNIGDIAPNRPKSPQKGGNYGGNKRWQHYRSGKNLRARSSSIASFFWYLPASISIWIAFIFFSCSARKDIKSFRAILRDSSVLWVYLSVTTLSAWPRSSCRIRNGTFASFRSVANECRKNTELGRPRLLGSPRRFCISHIRPEYPFPV